jgi:hypothetical protein
MSWAMFLANPLIAIPITEIVKSTIGTETRMKSSGAEPLERHNFIHRLIENALERWSGCRPH